MTHFAARRPGQCGFTIIETLVAGAVIIAVAATPSDERALVEEEAYVAKPTLFDQPFWESQTPPVSEAFLPKTSSQRSISSVALPAL